MPVVTVHKKGDKTKTSSYCPISLASATCNTVEHIIYSNIMRYHEKHTAINEVQHDFRSGACCSALLDQLCNDLLLGVQSGDEVVCVFVYFNKAFDKLDHRLLLHKLRQLRIDRDVLWLMEEYLKGRTECTVLNCVKSDDVHVTSGVPQGSVLGPLFLLIYVNDISHDI